MAINNSQQQQTGSQLNKQKHLLLQLPFNVKKAEEYTKYNNVSPILIRVQLGRREC